MDITGFLIIVAVFIGGIGILFDWRGILKRVEWNIFAMFFGGMLVWLIVIVPFLNGIALMNSMLSFILFLIVIGVIGYMVGGTVHRSVESFIVSVSLMLLGDLLMPPILLDFNVAPTAQLLTRWGSASFVYQLWGVTGLSHQVLWILTYVATPMMGMFLVLYFLSGRQLTDALKSMFNGR